MSFTGAKYSMKEQCREYDKVNVIITSTKTEIKYTNLTHQGKTLLKWDMLSIQDAFW